MVEIYSTGLMTAYKKHTYKTRIFYDDTDASGLVYHSNYLKIAERARTSMLYESGLTHQIIRDTLGGILVVKHIDIDYLSPTRLEDSVALHTKVLEVKGASVKLSQTIWKDEHLLVNIEIKLAFIDSSGRPKRFPVEVINAITL